MPIFPKKAVKIPFCCLFYLGCVVAGVNPGGYFTLLKQLTTHSTTSSSACTNSREQSSWTQTRPEEPQHREQPQCMKVRETLREQEICFSLFALVVAYYLYLFAVSSSKVILFQVLTTFGLPRNTSLSISLSLFPPKTVNRDFLLQTSFIYIVTVYCKVKMSVCSYTYRLQLNKI